MSSVVGWSERINGYVRCVDSRCVQEGFSDSELTRCLKFTHANHLA